MLDTLGMLDTTLGLPEQVAAAAAAAAEPDLPRADGIGSVVILGMGGSGIGGDVAAAVAGPTAKVPIVVSKHYECPGFVGPDSLVFASSFSGNTEETISAATTAAEAGARMVVMTSGGELQRLAGEWGAHLLPVDSSIPMPRAAIGAVTIPPLVALERMGLASGISHQIAAAIVALERRRDAMGSDQADAAALARQIGRTLPIVYGGGQLGEVAAVRWKGQVNENPKVAAFANRVPELTHNKICGWGQHGDVTRQVFTLLLLRHDHEHPQVGRRFEITEEICEEIVGSVLTVRAEGDGPLAQFMDLTLVGDLVTLHMAFQAGVDPGPVAILDEIKARLRT